MELKEKIAEELKVAVEKEKKSFFGFFITNFRFTYLILAIIIILGSYSILNLPREANPEIKVPFASVTTVFPGANPTDVEESITNKIEQRVKNVDNIKRFTSSSGLGISSIFVEFEAEADIKSSIDDLKNAVDLVKPDLPEDANDPVVSEINFSDFPIVTYSLVGDFSDLEMNEIAEYIQENFESIRNVSRVEILGGVQKEIQVILDKENLKKYNLSLGRIANSISLNNFNLPAGDMEIDDYNYNIRVSGKFNSLNELKNTVITTISETPIYLKDIATILETTQEKTSESRIGYPDNLPQNTISLQIYKKTGGNILEIVEESENKVEELKNSAFLPDNLTIEKTNDNAVFIREDLKTLGTSALQTMFLILVILMMVLSFRGSLITALSIPLAFLITFSVMKLQGATLNSLALFSLVISLGLMVDNSIIIIEGIAEYISKHKKSSCHAALLSVWNYKKPIIAGTLTTVSAFLPMLLVSGIMGEFIQVLPKTISAALLSSLFVSLVLIPTLSTRFIKIEEGKSEDYRNKKRHVYISNKIEKLKSFYTVFIKDILLNKSKRKKILIAVWVAFFISIAVPISGMLRIEMFPAIDNDYFVVDIKLPAGSSIDRTRTIVDVVEKEIRNINELANYVSGIGTNSSLGMVGGPGQMGSTNSHLASITVNLSDKDERKRKSFEISEDLREKLEIIKEAEVNIQEVGAGPPSGAPIEVRVIGNDFSELVKISEEVKNTLRNIEGTINIVDNISDSSGDFVFSVDRQKANFYGLSVVDVASEMRNAIFGTKASSISIDGDDRDIVLKYNDSEFKNIENLKDISIFNQRGEEVKLGQVSQVSLEPSVLSINHLDGDMVVVVNASTVEGANLQKILSTFDEESQKIDLKPGIEIRVGGETEEIAQSFREIFLSMILAVILIAFILVLQFNSFKQPLIIIFTLPLSIIGVVFGLVVLGLPFSFTAFLGIVALSGIVVNDAIVLIDKINKNVEFGMERIDAIIEGALARMQPIILTTLTTVAGVFPLIFASELWIGLSISVIFGLTFASTLTLVMIPILYLSFTDKEK